MVKKLLKGNEAFAEAAIRAGCEGFFGYPITPSTEFLEHMAKRMPELGRGFVQAESEVAAINMVYGAACTGKRAMTASSSPGISLMMEGISYIAGTEVPAVIVNVMRGGPGLGNIAPSQGDYNQMVKGGGHGDYFPIVLAPASVQEAIDYITLAFDLADKYRSLVFVIVDGNLGQMMEPAELPPMRDLDFITPEWAVDGETEGRERRFLSSIYIDPKDEEVTNIRLLRRKLEIEKNEILYHTEEIDDAEIVIVAFGTAGRVASTAVRQARQEGIKVGLFRPITLSPFPYKEIEKLADQAKSMLVAEMNTGMMLDDVSLSVKGKIPIEFYGRMGGITPFPDEILDEIRRINNSPPTDTDFNAREAWLDRLELIIEGEN
ncbi:MAG: 3-methyl-2-oxobutanoate dehydrogenase subunit VorB [Chloroflexi bacterium]|jgi:2-oxoglutarate/2-oxoacid ferredoxin oxidoreductase subunit alpha|nr:3-methyl-2-oxobutanoate dehydrogenase subunit VorB [Chloroflexota bacterium]MBT3669790.1 3-methyl-2-oxobutanoate dehydrogenase subunit VorB [Chloroflexota bacterium]MBT4304691.1 3-methyl-2-oxobutanoate dehydrogenase subunit VorB [Chloroflexota bacterium]MBT4534807.1 3-methyl-2-oxobutanoate dehydrogenase subunit VorB [Chloroflexota bacterium]MBT4683891.1 3-methyl-2-oxobutanoate dehydrogenase subunit VorB [Chloroflexota bacterium]